MLDLSILIVNTNNKKMTEEFLKSIYQKTIGISFEVILVDNLSTDGSLEMVKRDFPSVVLIKNKCRMSFTRNYNIAMKKSRGKYIALVNEDMLLENNAFFEMVSFLESRKSVGAVGCKLLNGDKSLQLSAWKRFPSPGVEFMLYSLLYLVMERAFRLREYPFRYALYPDEHEEERKVAFLIGACITIRREILDTIGYLDEATDIYLSEPDWCRRIKNKGWEIYYIPQGRIIHFGGGSIKRNSLREVSLGLEGSYFYFKKHYRIIPSIFVGIIYNLGALIKIVLHLGMLALNVGSGEMNKYMIKNGFYVFLWHLKLKFLNKLNFKKNG